MIRGSILDSIRGIMVTPEKYIVKMTDEADIFQLKYPTPKVTGFIFSCSLFLFQLHFLLFRDKSYSVEQFRFT